MRAKPAGIAPDIVQGKGEVRAISRSEAASVIEQFEAMPGVVKFCFGIFFGERLGGAVVFSPEYAENLNVWDKFGFSGRLLLLSRGACLAWTPKGSGSRLIRAAMKQLPAEIEIVSGTLDARLGEVGSVYKAAGFIHAAMSPPGGRYAVRGLTSRSARRQGLGTKAALVAAGLKPRREHRKARVFCFRGRHAETHLQAIRHLIRPYPPRVIPRASTAA